MSIKKWIMKQYWRVGTIRALASLGLGMLVLGRLYYGYIPLLTNLGLIGALILGFFLFALFIGIGWLYDEKGQMWSQKSQVLEERNPFRYVPNFKALAFEYPVLYSYLKTINEICDEMGIKSNELQDLSNYLRSYFSKSVNKEDIFSSTESGREFIKKHPFENGAVDFGDVPLSSKGKLFLQKNIIRIGWIQSLTGLMQDVLVFGVFYATILFPELPSGLTPLYAAVFVSIPLLAFLTLLGWYYDKQLKVWSADIAVKVERNPFSYVLEPYLRSFFLPFFYAISEALLKICNEMQADTKSLEETIRYLDRYSQLEASKEEDIQKGKLLSKRSIAEFKEN